MIHHADEQRATAVASKPYQVLHGRCLLRRGGRLRAHRDGAVLHQVHRLPDCKNQKKLR